MKLLVLAPATVVLLVACGGPTTPTPSVGPSAAATPAAPTATPTATNAPPTAAAPEATATPATATPASTESSTATPLPDASTPSPTSVAGSTPELQREMQAGEIPPFPNAFSGTAFLGEDPADTGLQLFACVATCDAGWQSDPIEVGETGRFVALVAQPPSTAFLDQQVTFYLIFEGANLSAAQTSTFSGNINDLTRDLNLRFPRPASPAEPITTELSPTRDNTLIEGNSFSCAVCSNGAGTSLFAGRVSSTGAGTIRRAVIAFDVGGPLPPRLDHQQRYPATSYVQDYRRNGACAHTRAASRLG